MYMQSKDTARLAFFVALNINIVFIIFFGVKALPTYLIVVNVDQLQDALGTVCPCRSKTFVLSSKRNAVVRDWSRCARACPPRVLPYQS